MGKKRKGSNKRGQNNLPDAVSDNEDGLGGDELYDEVDAWDRDQEKELIAATRKKDRKSFQENREMFALSGTDSDSDLELPKLKKNKKKKQKSEAEKQIELNDEDFLGSDVEGADGDNLRSWGSKKKHFYGGNTGEGVVTSDSEFDEDEAEEKEAELLQERQLNIMEEEDFLDAFIPQDKKQEKKEEEETVEESVKRDLTKLSQKERSALFRQLAPEFDGIVLDFREKMSEAIKLSKIVSLEDGGKIPKSPVSEYVRTKFQVLTNYCTNITAYLMFRSKGTNLKLHPVTGRLVQYKQLIDSFEPMDEIVNPQVESLLERLEQGESIEAIVKEERRRHKKQLKKSKEKNKKLKILQPALDSKEDDTEEPVKDVLKKRKHERLDDLTGDERLAVDLYKAIKRNKVDLEAEDSEGDEGATDEETGDAAEDGVVHNDDVDLDGDTEAEKRGITYQIAKNKGLMPKRNKLQRNPRVKNRVKFEKAKKRRKGAVREVRKETTRYGGEISGINARVRKGVKFR